MIPIRKNNNDLMIHKNIRLLESRTKLLYAKILEKIQKEFPDIVRRDAWQRVRTDILNLSNDIVRANKADFDDMERSYKTQPFILSCNIKGQKTIMLSNNALNVFKDIRFVDNPYEIIIRVRANDYNIEVIDQIAKACVFGETKYDKGFITYIISKDDCIKVLGFFNMIPFRRDIKDKYEQWKKNLSNWYFAHGDW